MASRALQEATLLVLTALSRGSRHGHGIIADVQEISGGRVKLRAGTLYTALDQLRVAGLVAVDREEIVANRPRRYYRLVPAPGTGSSRTRDQPAPGPELRVGDAEREAAAAALGEHFAQGRLTFAEFLARLDAALTATMQSEIAHTARDLPQL